MYGYIFSGEATFSDFSLDTLAAVESELGVKLPKSYIDLMHTHNGGYLQYDSFRSYKLPDRKAEISDIKGIDLKEGIIESNSLVDEWELPKDLVIFSGDGNYWLAFDYRKYSGDNPAVVYIEVDGEDGEKPSKIARNFEAFVKKLEQEEPLEFDDEDDDEYDG